MMLVILKNSVVFGNNSSDIKEEAQKIACNLASASGSVTVTDPIKSANQQP